MVLIQEEKKLRRNSRESISIGRLKVGSRREREPLARIARVAFSIDMKTTEQFFPIPFID
jgi:hypothetical protein